MLADNDIVQKEYDEPSCPLVNYDEIWFNGKGDDGHETFVIKREDKPQEWREDKETVFGFCKTAQKPYDIYVTAVLLLAKINLEDEIQISSDGCISDWQPAVDLINKKLNSDLEVLENPDEEYPDSIGTAIIKATTHPMPV